MEKFPNPLEGLLVVCEGFLNLKSPYVRVALGRSREEGKEKESVFHPVESSTAVVVKPHSSRTGDKGFQCSLKLKGSWSCWG